MSPSQTLSRPLASRVGGLPAPADEIVHIDVPEPVARAAVKAMQDGHTHYTDRPGIQPLRAHIVRQLKQRFGVDYPAGEVTITCGATEARYVALKLLAQQGTTVICPDHLPEIAAAAQLLGVRVTTDADDTISNAIVHLTASTPTATSARLVAIAATRGWWVIFDTSAGSGEHPAKNEALAPRVISIGSLSEPLPSWRVGWVAGSSMAGKLRAFKQSMTICTTSVSQWAALGLVEGEG